MRSHQSDYEMNKLTLTKQSFINTHLHFPPTATSRNSLTAQII